MTPSPSSPLLFADGVTGSAIDAVSTAIPIAVSDGAVTITATAGSEWAAAERDWAELWNSSPYRSYFLSPHWIGSWIKTYQQSLEIEILRFSHGSRLVGICLLVWRHQRSGPLWIRKVYLNATGEDQWEEAGTEFNDLLCIEGWERQVAAAVRGYIEGRGWDELVLNGCQRSAAIGAILDALSEHEHCQRSQKLYYVDLQAIRRSGGSLEQSLSARARRSLRQNARLCAELGELQCQRAESLEEAARMLNELIGLHQKRWHGKGQKGAFVSPRFRQFHETMLSRCFELGQVDLLRVCAGSESIGFIYNYVADGKVYFYQSGFRSFQKKHSPGTVTLIAAIQSYLASSLSEFDLMAGGEGYKKNFSKNFRQLDWHIVRRATWRNAIIGFLRASRNRVGKLAHKSMSV